MTIRLKQLITIRELLYLNKPGIVAGTPCYKKSFQLFNRREYAAPDARYWILQRHDGNNTRHTLNWDKHISCFWTIRKWQYNRKDKSLNLFFFLRDWICKEQILFIYYIAWLKRFKFNNTLPGLIANQVLILSVSF